MSVTTPVNSFPSAKATLFDANNVPKTVRIETKNIKNGLILNFFTIKYFLLPTLF